jgi:hypothetical protein
VQPAHPHKGLIILRPLFNLQEEEGTVHLHIDQDLQAQPAPLLVPHIHLQARILPILDHHPIMLLREDR